MVKSGYSVKWLVVVTSLLISFNAEARRKGWQPFFQPMVKARAVSPALPMPPPLINKTCSTATLSIDFQPGGICFIKFVGDDQQQPGKYYGGPFGVDVTNELTGVTTSYSILKGGKELKDIEGKIFSCVSNP